MCEFKGVWVKDNLWGSVFALWAPRIEFKLPDL